MTDRELLELSAKAAGLQVKGWVGDALWFYDDITNSLGGWNPLTDDGDALRLAVKLGITIDMHDCCAWSRGQLGMIQEFWGGDFDPCYRRAIVRAAAEIGKNAA